jgi:purine-nucleoside phosphorylase
MRPETPDGSYADLVREAKRTPPELALILGSGMSGLGRTKQVTCEVPFSKIDGLGVSTVTGHAGTLSLTNWRGRSVLIFAGRLHYYEGYSWDQVIQPVRLAYHLGARMLVLTNAAGGIHPELEPGSLMVIRDHIPWTAPDSWRYLAAREVRKPSPYSSKLGHALHRSAQATGQWLADGVYAAVLGPCYETLAEIRALAVCGADAVGMSTAREAQAAYSLGMECAAISCITNRAAGLGDGPISHEEVLNGVAAQADRLDNLLENFIQMA